MNVSRHGERLGPDLVCPATRQRYRAVSADATLALDIQLIWLTALAVTSKPAALRGVVALLERLGAPPDLVEIARRDSRAVRRPSNAANRRCGRGEIVMDFQLFAGSIFVASQMAKN